MGAGGGVSAAQPWGPQWGGQRAASPPSAMRWGHPGAKTPPPTPPPTPPRARHRPPPCPSLPGTVTARPLFAKGVLFCPSRCQQSSQGMGGGTERGAVPGPPTPPKEPHWGVSTSTIRPCGPLTPSARGGLWLPSQPHVCPHPSPGGVRGVPTQCEVPGGAAQDPAQGLCTAGTAGSVGGTAPQAPPWHRGGDEMAWGPWWQTMGAVVARGPQRHTMRAAMAHRGDHNGRGTTMAHRGHYDGTPWGPQQRIIGTVMAGGPW